MDLGLGRIRGHQSRSAPLGSSDLESAIRSYVRHHRADHLRVVQATQVQVFGIIEVVKPGVIEYRFSIPTEEFSELPNVSDLDYPALEPAEFEP